MIFPLKFEFYQTSENRCMGDGSPFLNQVIQFLDTINPQVVIILGAQIYSTI